MEIEDLGGRVSLLVSGDIKIVELVTDRQTYWIENQAKSVMKIGPVPPIEGGWQRTILLTDWNGGERE